MATRVSFRRLALPANITSALMLTPMSTRTVTPRPFLHWLQRHDLTTPRFSSAKSDQPPRPSLSPADVEAAWIAKLKQEHGDRWQLVVDESRARRQCYHALNLLWNSLKPSRRAIRAHSRGGGDGPVVDPEVARRKREIAEAGFMSTPASKTWAKALSALHGEEWKKVYDEEKARLRKAFELSETNGKAQALEAQLRREASKQEKDAPKKQYMARGE